MTFIVNELLVDQVLDPILDLYARGEYPFDIKRTMLDEFEVPRRLGRSAEAKARFWFFANMFMRGGIDSDVALRALSRLYDQEMTPTGKRPFDPKYARKISVKEMTGLLKEAGTSLYRLARDWVECAKLLYERYQGKVLRLLEGIKDYDSAVKLLRNHKGSGFPGFQFKMVSMFIFFMTEAGLLDYFPYPPPVDFHLQRVPVQTKMITREDGSSTVGYGKDLDRLQEALRGAYLDYIIRRGIKSNFLSDAVWLFSRNMCKFNPGNRTSKGDYKARSTKLTTHEVDWTTPRDRNKYARSCGQCPIREHCLYNVPSAYYYTQGKIKIASKRQDSPVMDLGFKVKRVKPKPKIQKASKHQVQPQGIPLTLNI